MKASETRILVVGAGPVGLSLGLGLARAGFAVDVFEALPSLALEARASTWHPPTLEMLAEWGVAETMIERGAKVDRLQFWERENRALVAEFPYTLLAGDTPYPFRFQCPQHVVTPILRDAFVAAGGRIHFGHRALGVVEEENNIALRVTSPAGETVVRGAWLCGADGAHSAIRQSLGIGLVGKTYEDRFLLVGSHFDFASVFPGLGPVGYVFDPDEWVIVMRLRDIVRVVFRIPPEEDQAWALSDARIQERLERLLGRPHDVPIAVRSIYSVHQRVADRFRQGRALLLGDAAHLNNPAGGLGMNSGIHDAYRLVQAFTGATPTTGVPSLSGAESSANAASSANPASSARTPSLTSTVSSADLDTRLDQWAASRRRAASDSVQQVSDKSFRDLQLREAEARKKRNAELAATASDPARARVFLLRTAMMEDRAGSQEAP